jgi:chemotaxis protein MotA
LTEFIRDNMERTAKPDAPRRRQQDLPAIGDCAPAFGMIGTLIGMVQMFAK